MELDWHPCLENEFEKLVDRMNRPRVVIDNAVCPTATLVKVDSARKRGILLEAVQVLTDLDLTVTKAYISSDGRWFMDVFHVTDSQGRKLADDSVMSYIEQTLAAYGTTRNGSSKNLSRPGSFGGSEDGGGLTALELVGIDRPGLLSEVFAVLADLGCGVVDAKVWTNNGRIAAIISLKDDEAEVEAAETDVTSSTTGRSCSTTSISGSSCSSSSSSSPIADSGKIHAIESRLRHVLKGDNTDVSAAAAVSSMGVTHAERRLHQMMFADRDYERVASGAGAGASSSATRPSVTVQNWVDRGYSIVNVQCRDRPKLLFDIVCTLTDMDYVVFHGTIDTLGDQATQEFYIRHADGSPISSEAEKQRVILCVQAAIERRASEGVCLELRTLDRRGLLSEVTRSFRENGLTVTRAEISTRAGAACNAFYVADVAGRPIDPSVLESVRERVGAEELTVLRPPSPLSPCRKAATPAEDQEAASSSSGGGMVGLLALGSLVRRNLYNLGLIRSCS